MMRTLPKQNTNSQITYLLAAADSAAASTAVLEGSASRPSSYILYLKVI